MKYEIILISVAVLLAVAILVYASSSTVISDLNIYVQDLFVTNNVTVGGYLNLTHSVAGATFIIATNDSINKEKADYVCDGVDDQVEIQVALDALNGTGGTVQLLTGSYIITDTIEIPQGVTLAGMGAGIDEINTHLRWFGSGTKPIIAYNTAAADHGDDLRGAGIYNLEIAGRNIAGSIGIRIRKSYLHTIQNVAIKETEAEGILIESSFGEHIEKCKVRLAGTVGIKITGYDAYGSTLITITKCDIGNSNDYQIEADAGWPININQCWFENGAAHGKNSSHLHINGTTANPYVIATDNIFGSLQGGNQSILMDGGQSSLRLNHNYLMFEGTGEKGIVMAKGNLIAHSNWFDGIDDYAIDITGGAADVGDVVVEGNFFDKCGITAVGGKLQIVNNHFFDVATPYVININADYTNPLISGNWIYDANQHGIYTESTKSVITNNMLLRIGQGTNNTYDAIYINADNCKADGNLIQSNHANKTRYGIYATNQNEVSVTDNYVQGTATYDIYLTSGSNYKVLGNTFSDGKVSVPNNPTDIYSNNIGYNESNIIGNLNISENINVDGCVRYNCSQPTGCVVLGTCL